MSEMENQFADLVHQTIDRDFLTLIIDEQVPEGFQLEYKREIGDGSRVLDAISAFANTFGGVILVGVDEERSRPDSASFGAPGLDGLVGVLPKEKSRLAAICSSRLAPPFDPFIDSIDLGNGLVVLVVRIDPELAPRPLMNNNKVLIRTESGNRPADYFRLCSLFQGFLTGRSTDSVGSHIRVVQNPAFQEELPADFILQLSGIAPIAVSRTRTLFGDKVRRQLRDVLRSSKLSEALSSVQLRSPSSSRGISYWEDLGLNMSNRLDVRYKAHHHDGVISPEARCIIEVSPKTAPTFVRVTIEILVRIPNLATTVGIPELEIGDLYELINAALQTYSTNVRQLLRGISRETFGNLENPYVGIALHPNRTVSDIFSDLTPLELPKNISNPTLFGEVLIPIDINLNDASERENQSRQVLREILLDSRFLGVDDLIEEVKT